MMTYRFVAIALGLVLAATIVGQVATLPAAEQDWDWHQLRGTYFATGLTSCVVSSTGFNPNLTPAAGGVVYLQSASVQGIWKFHGDGTGTGQLTELQITLPPSGFPGGTGVEDSFPFTHTVADDGVLTFVPGLVSGTITAGPLAGLIFSVNIPPLSGRMAKEGTAITLASTVPAVETLTVETPSGTLVAKIPRICHRTRVLIPVHAD